MNLITMQMYQSSLATFITKFKNVGIDLGDKEQNKETLFSKIEQKIAH